MSENPLQTLAYASDEPPPWYQQPRWNVFQWLALTLGHGLEALFILGGITGLLGIAFGGAGPGILSVAVLLTASAAAAAARNARRFRAYRIMSYLQQAVRANLPLAPMMRSAALGETGAMRNRLERLQFHLYDGAPLAEALAASVPEMTDRPLTLIHTAETNGQLPQVLDQLIDEHERYTSPTLFRLAFCRVYLVFLFLGLGAVATMLNVFVIPKFRQIFRDFGIDTPWVLRTYLDYSRVLLTPMVVLGAVLLVHLLSSIARESFSPRLRNFSPLRTLVDHLYWYLPVIGRLEQDRGLADVCQALSSACRTGRPIDLAVAEAANLYMNTVLQSNIADWAMGISAGQSLSGAAKDARLPNLIVQMVKPSQSSSDLAQTFDFLHRYYCHRFSRTMILLNAIFVPLLTLLAGALVLMTAMAIFEPIVRLTEAVSPKGLTL